MLHHQNLPLHLILEATRWWFDPSNHGKGECDSHGAVVKNGMHWFVLNGMNFLYICDIVNISIRQSP
jgi:hypothetical protein